jgi:ABC-type transporter Mla subunit MlaD
MTHEAIDVQKDSIHQFVDAIENVERLAEQNNDVSRQAAHAYFDAMSSMLPEGGADFSDFEQLVDDGFDQLTESQAQTFEAMNDAMADGASAYDEFADAYVDAVDSSFDSFLDAHEDVEAEVEGATESLSA